MENFIIRTEDYKSTEIKKYYVETKQDRRIIDMLKSQHQLLLVGSRGVGKTMLLRMAEREMNDSYETNKSLPVYISFSKGILVNCDLNSSNFRHWMLSKILSAFRSALTKKGIITTENNPFEMLFGKTKEHEKTSLDKFIDILESTWNKSIQLDKEKIIEILNIDHTNYKIVDDVDFVKTVIEQFCESFGIDKVVLLFDEACHNFIPEQQREFFTLFRDLRSPFICCKAAVYPGITYYGTIQTFHDVITMRIERNINDDDYIEKMREIVASQLSDKAYNLFEQRGQEFNSLILCSSGNPRLLLKSLELASNGFKRFNKTSTNNTIKEFYRVQIWQEHSKLSNTYSGHKELIDWGRYFIEEKVLNVVEKMNESRKPRQTIYFCIHQDAPEKVRRAVRILEYSGIIELHTEGTKVSGRIYDRYQINFGIVAANEVSIPIVSMCDQLYKGLSVKVYAEFGMDSSSYKELMDNTSLEIMSEDKDSILKTMLTKPITTLDISDKIVERLHIDGLTTIEDILVKEESDLQKIHYIGPKRSRQIYNSAYNAAIEYISG